MPSVLLTIGAGVVFQPERLVHDRHDAAGELFCGCGFEDSGRGERTALLPAGRVEFLEKILHFRRQVGDVARRAAVGQVFVGPQVTEHFDEVRLAAPVKSADPHRRLLLLGSARKAT